MTAKLRIADRRLTDTPRLTRKDPSMLFALGSKVNRSRIIIKDLTDPSQQSSMKKCCIWIYDKHNKTFCDRSCDNWLRIIGYSIMYLIFLSTYTMIILYGSLMYLKSVPPDSDKNVETFELTYSENSIGLSATPTSEDSYPLIWYRYGEADDYEKYVKAIEKLMADQEKKRDLVSNLGPCGQPPYGYGDKPCVFVRIYKNLQWSAKPLQPDSPAPKDMPNEVRDWIKNDRKFWLHCSGFNSYDKEHIRDLRYYPNPPGFDSELLSMDMTTKSQLVAVQLSNFTLGLSLAIECKLWYDSGVSSVAFMLYVAPNNTLSMRKKHYHARF